MLTREFTSSVVLLKTKAARGVDCPTPVGKVSQRMHEENNELG